MNAKEMFEELGYRRYKGMYDECYLVYRKGLNDIIFDLEDNVFVKRCPLGFLCINTKELKAINKQVEELWSDDILKNNGNK